jgi:hypothetical protein
MADMSQMVKDVILVENQKKSFLGDCASKEARSAGEKSMNASLRRFELQHYSSLD